MAALPRLSAFVLLVFLGLCATPACAGSPPLSEQVQQAAIKGDSAWMMMSTALVLVMLPGLALFYGGMVRRKNVLATMMHSMAALAIVGVFWISVGYALAFGDPWIRFTDSEGKVYSFLGFNSELLFLHGVSPKTLVPGTNIPVYLHLLFQGMFAIITPALISGALAERIRFQPYCLFVLLWVALIYCPLAHMVWALNWNWYDALSAAPRLLDPLGNPSGTSPVGWLGALGALDFAGGTVVHIAAGFSSLAAILVLRRRHGYPEQAFHPNSMVLTLTGAGLLWFGWFGFNGGSAGASGPLAVSAFAATQAAAAAAGLAWMLVEWWHRGKPTALGLASGIVAGLVAVTPASGYIYPWGGLLIGLVAGVLCYAAVALKPWLKYDDSLDAFGVHGVGGFVGALLTGVLCYAAVQDGSKDGLLAGATGQVLVQTWAALVAAVLAFGGALALVVLIDRTLGFTVDEEEEVEGLDHIEHGEVGFDFGLAGETAAVVSGAEPRSAIVPPTAAERFSVVVSGTQSGDLMKAWSDLCQPGPTPPSAEFKAVYPHMTTVQGNRFHFRSGDPETIRQALETLLESKLPVSVRAHIERM